MFRRELQRRWGMGSNVRVVRNTVFFDQAVELVQTRGGFRMSKGGLSRKRHSVTTQGAVRPPNRAELRMGCFGESKACLVRPYILRWTWLVAEMLVRTSLDERPGGHLERDAIGRSCFWPSANAKSRFRRPPNGNCEHSGPFT
jgi:hypothetical protein